MCRSRQVRLRYQRHNRKFSVPLKGQIRCNVTSRGPAYRIGVLGLIDKDSLALKRYRSEKGSGLFSDQAWR